MTYPWPWLNVLAFSGCRLARCCSVLSMRITIFQGSPLTRWSVLANCRACVLERLSSVVMATLACDCKSFEKREGCRPENRAASLRDAHIGFQGGGMWGCYILMPSHSTTPDWSPTVQINITNLIDDVQCYQTVRELRWPDGITCPSCASQHIIKRGCDDTESARQRYECHDCDKRFDDLTDTIFAGHHQPLKVWVLCLYFMGLNLSNEQIAHELSFNESDAYQMTTALRGGIVKKSQR